MNRYRIYEQGVMNTNGQEKTITVKELSELDDNSIDFIDCSNILEIVEAIEFIKLLESKLRLTGSCFLVGIDINLLCEYYLDNLIGLDFFNKIIADIRNLYTLDKILSILDNQFTIKEIKTYGLYYNVIIERKGYAI